MKRAIFWIVIFLLLTGCNGQAINVEIPRTGLTTQFATAKIDDTNAPAAVRTTFTPDPTFITITSIQENPNNHTVTLLWETNGVFPQGFKIIFSEKNVNPTYPIDPFVYVEDGGVRQAKVQVQPGKTYHFRVCKFEGNDCTYYSQTRDEQIPFLEPSPVPATPTPTPDNTALTILRISSQDKGLALMQWQAEGQFSNGFKILSSKTNANPTFPEDSSQDVSDPTSRSAVLTGEETVQYFYRICKFDGQKCVFYSNSYAYTFDGSPQPTSSGNKISISNISDQSQGKALLSWNASGSFPNGFRVVWSPTHAYPLYPDDENIYLNDGSSRSAVVSGIPGTLYYYRVCEFNGLGCGSYSLPVPFRLAAEPTPVGGLITITSISNLATGKALVEWNAEGSFASGFKIVWSDSNPNPVYPGDLFTPISDPSVRSAQVSGLQGKTYYFRVCRTTDMGCDIYSQSYLFTFGIQSTPVYTQVPGQISILNLTSTDPGKAVIVWNASGDFPLGFKVVWSDSNSSPAVPGDANIYLSDPGARSAQVSGNPGKTYYFRVCRFTGTGCDLYSSSTKFTYSGYVILPPAKGEIAVGLTPQP